MTGREGVSGPVPEYTGPRRRASDRQPPGMTTAGALAGLNYTDVPRLELDQLLQQLRDRAGDVLATQDRLRGLLRANAVVAADLSLPVVLRSIVEVARELLGARYAALGVIGHDGRLEQFVHTGMDEERVARIGSLPQGRGILGLLITHPQPIRLANLATHQASVGFPADHPPMASFLGAPIRVGEDVFGNLYLTERVGGGEFTAEDEALATALAAAAGGAIANARLFSESEQRRRWLASSGEVTYRLLATDTEEPLGVITQEAAAASGADFAILSVPADEDQLVVEAVAGVLVAELRGRSFPIEGSLTGRAIHTGKPELITDYRAGPYASLLQDETGPLIVVPLVAGARTRGAISLGRLADRPAFTDTDVEMAAAFANQAAIALELVEARSDQLKLTRLEDHDRIARDLHDHVIQELFAVGMGLEGLASSIDKPVQANRINGYVDSLDRVISQIRSTIFQLQPRRHDPMGLQAQVLAIMNAHSAQLGFVPRIRFSGPLDVAVEESLAEDILAVIREGLSNAARHAGADRVDVSLSLENGVVSLEIVDNGRGIGTPTRSSGVANLRKRAEQSDGSLEFSVPEGGGTQLTWTARLPR